MAEFGRRIGVSGAYVTSMRKSIQPDKVEKIKSEFPELNIDWLLTGNGAMCVSDLGDVEVMSTPTDGATPVYDVNASCGDGNLPMEFLDEHIIGYVNMPNVSKSASIIRANGDSMSPAINDGDFIAVREVTDMEDIFYGQVYLVLTSEYRMVKYIRKYEPDEDNYVLLRSENPNYDDIKMKKSKIIKMFIVENILSLKVKM